MPELTEMLAELIDMLDDGEIDECFHDNPADPDEWCDYCFVSNMRHVSLDEPYFTEETTERQRDAIQRIWSRICDEADWEDLDDLL